MAKPTYEELEDRVKVLEIVTTLPHAIGLEKAAAIVETYHLIYTPLINQSNWRETARNMCDKLDRLLWKFENWERLN